MIYYKCFCTDIILRSLIERQKRTVSVLSPCFQKTWDDYSWAVKSSHILWLLSFDKFSRCQFWHLPSQQPLPIGDCSSPPLPFCQTSGARLDSGRERFYRWTEWAVMIQPSISDQAKSNKQIKTHLRRMSQRKWMGLDWLWISSGGVKYRASYATNIKKSFI